MRAPGLTVALLVVAVFVGACRREPPRSEPLAGPVVISASCSENAVQSSVNPWVARVRLGHDLEWRLDAASGVGEVAILQINDWPYLDAPPKVRKGASGKGTRMKTTVKAGDKFQYNVSFLCPDGRRILIDPDIIIINDS